MKSDNFNKDSYVQQGTDYRVLIRMNKMNRIYLGKIFYLIQQMNNKLSSLYLKKSYSLIERKQQSPQNQHEQITHETNPQQSPIQQLIRLKYNFTFRVKPLNPYYKPIKKLSNNNFISLLHDTPVKLPNQSLRVSILPQLEKKQQNFSRSVFQNEQIKLHQNQNKKYPQKLKTKLTQRQNEKQRFSFIDNYTFLKGPQKRNLNEYKKCLKNIQLNTTYRGFNTPNKSNKESKTFNFKVQSSENRKSQKMSMYESSKDSNINERKRIVNYIIERGFARKMEESLMKIRKEKKRVHEETLSGKNSNNNSPVINKMKRSVVFTISPPLNKDNQIQMKDGQKKQQSIDPW